jgi:anti-sigma factor RsiW
MSERKDKKGDRVLRCDECENLIADALDGTLSAADAAALERHKAECPLCMQMFRETEQGRNWMQYLVGARDPARASQKDPCPDQ